ncbi:MAG: winged helix-turn-helix transcriptional regulator [Candidatus Lokiarchaeota archaeon]|nr:winged helix-turn-helix transcriptional regulator [Candidatus Lokiarchaeota archaeon]
MKEIDFSDFVNFAKALHCQSRYLIVEFLRSGPKTSDQLYKLMKESKIQAGKCKGECKNQINQNMKKPAFYYHLRELESAGIIELQDYKPSEKKKAPKKVWRLKIDKFFMKVNE